MQVVLIIRRSAVIDPLPVYRYLCILVSNRERAITYPIQAYQVKHLQHPQAREYIVVD